MKKTCSLFANWPIFHNNVSFMTIQLEKLKYSSLYKNDCLFNEMKVNKKIYIYVCMKSI